MAENDKFYPHEGLTFDDVLLVPAYSEVIPGEVNTSTLLTRNIHINTPILAAAMDTVSEAPMAIAMARLGGIAIIHKNMSIRDQAEHVKRVKRSESGMIDNPITLSPRNRIIEALQLVKEKGISGLPIIDENGILKGILTNRDLRFVTDQQKEIREFMTSHNLITAPESITMEEAKRLLHINKIEKLPVVDRDGRLKGLITLKDIMKSEEFPQAAKDTFGRLRVGAAVGTSADTLERAAALAEMNVDVIVVDTSHGHSLRVLQTVAKVRERFPDIDLIAGNIATAAAARELRDRGVDAVKVGIGPGSICTTRMVTGAGMPQITAIMDVARELKGEIPLIADGGIKYSGDIAKALAAGAHSVMLGSLLAGTDESPGEFVIYQGRSYKSYRGMGSIGAMKAGSRDRYFQEDEYSESKLVPEGIEGRVPHRGSVTRLLPMLIGGTRAGMGLTGCRSIAELHEKARFVRISSAALRESHVHDVIITEEPPNYHLG